jgi:hypothetical protein
MGFPFIFESNFELGTNAEWDSETDTGSRLNYPHYATLAKYDVTSVGPVLPWRGAFVAEWNLGDTNDHTLIRSTIAIADTASAYTRFLLFLGKDLAATADDTFSIYELQGTANAQESVIALKITAATQAIQIGVGQTQATVSLNANSLPRGRYYTIELLTTVSTTGSGVSTLFVDGTQYATVTGITNTAVLRGVLGTQDTLSTTTGHLFIDAFVFDEARIYPISIRYPETILLTKSAHVFVGSGTIRNISLLSGAGTDNVLTVFDTDEAKVLEASTTLCELKNTANGQIVDPVTVPVDVRRGCFVQLAGTNPRAIVQIDGAQGYWSVGRIRQHGFKRQNNSQVGLF